MQTTLVMRLVTASIAHRLLIISLSIAVFALSAFYAVTHFAITTDTAQLISANTPWRKLELAFDHAFPKRTSLTVVVIDAPTPELAERAARDLFAQLPGKPGIKTVERPDASPFFAANGLLFLSKEEVAKTANQLLAAQPFLGSLAADPSLRGLMSTLQLMARGVSEKATTFEQLAPQLKVFTEAIGAINAGHGKPFSWRELLTGQKAEPRDLRKIILVQPILDFSALEPGNLSADTIRDTARALGITPEHGYRVRLTGSVPLSDEEFATVADGAELNGIITVLVVLFILWLALRHFRIIAAVFAALVVGLAATAAVGLLMVGALNLISVAFAVLFVGLGVDFGLQFSVRYREERHKQHENVKALIETGRQAGAPLALAAASVAAGFYSFLPTEYRGLSELGLIAGTGMIIAFITSVTLLPALLSLMRLPDEPRSMGYTALAPVDHFLSRHRIAVLVATGLISIGGLPLLLHVRFDFNPINLRSAKVESVSTFFDLTKDPYTTPNIVDTIAPNAAEAAALAEKFDKLPEVDHTITLASFVPTDQEAKLAQIEDLAILLGPTLHPGEVKPAPSDAESVAALDEAAAALRKAADDNPDDKGDAEARRLADALADLAKAPPERRVAAADALLPGLSVVLDQTREALEAQHIDFGDLPDDLKNDWTAKDGRTRVEIYPKGDSTDNEVLRRFVAALRTVTPNLTGAPVSIQESGHTIVNAFIQAGLWALISISILLYIVLRRVGDVLLTLVPLIVAGVITLEACALIGMPLNFANIIALPLLLGVGVAFKVYFVMAWRAGETNLLQSSLTRAVFFSAMTTATAFGSLWLSKHPGTSSMGKLLALSLVCTLLAAVFFQPALMGPPRAKKGRGALQKGMPELIANHVLARQD